MIGTLLFGFSAGVIWTVLSGYSLLRIMENKRTRERRQQIYFRNLMNAATIEEATWEH